MSGFGVDAMICRFGEEITLTSQGKKRRAKAVIQPLLYKNKMYIDGDVTSLGITDSGRYLMIGQRVLKDTDWHNAVISDRLRTYTVSRAEIITCGKEDLYIWAVLIPCTKRAEDDYDESDRIA